MPVVRRALSVAAIRLGISCNPNCGLFAFPAVSDFIGGDIIADILACGMAEREETSLLIDIGTNFEVVLGNKEWMFSCAGAAGPALEGGEVLFGMRANPGAIERVTLDPVTLDPVISTINEIKPRGITGSGLIDLLAELLAAGVIDRTGRIDTGIDNPRLRAGSHFPEFVVVWEKETDIGKDIVITENDIKNLIMSKASIHAACVTLMKEAGVSRREITTIYFAGAFGNYINKKNATIIGLIPEIGINHVKNIGNGAVAGANIALINRSKRKTLDEIAYKIAYIELNAESSFMDEYTSSSPSAHRSLALSPCPGDAGIFPEQDRLISMAENDPVPPFARYGRRRTPPYRSVEACGDVLVVFPEFPYIPTLPDRGDARSNSLQRLRACSPAASSATTGSFSTARRTRPPRWSRSTSTMSKGTLRPTASTRHTRRHLSR